MLVTCAKGYGRSNRIQQLAESGDYAWFNAIVGALLEGAELDATAIDVIRRDPEVENRITASAAPG